MVDTQPKDSNTVTAYLSVKGADKAIEFYKYVFGAKEKFRMDGPNGTVAHAQLTIGDSSIMVAEDRPEMDMGVGKTTNNLYVYVGDADAAFKKAKEKGAKVVMEPQDMFYGDRSGCFVDPFGQVWSAATHVEDVSDEEVKERAKKFYAKKAA